MIKNGTLVSHKFTIHEIIYGIVTECISLDLLYKVRATNHYLCNDLIHFDCYISEKDLTIIGE